ncbi:unnamed protein product, partial [Linum tenue]
HQTKKLRRVLQFLSWKIAAPTNRGVLRPALSPRKASINLRRRTRNPAARAMEYIL